MLILWGLTLILAGLFYLWQPTFFRRGIWMKTSIAIRLLSERNYVRYMRGLGVVCILLGLGFIVFAAMR